MKSLRIVVFLIILMLQMEGNLRSECENLLSQRLHNDGFLTVGVLVEILEVPAPVEDVEKLLVLSFAKYILRQTCSSSNHLHILDFALYSLEENEVQHIGHVYSRVEHIHRHSNLRITVTYLKPVDEVL